MKLTLGIPIIIQLLLVPTFQDAPNELSYNTNPILTESIETNVGNNKPYNYTITSIEGNKIHGKATNKISNDNHGIFLYKDELPFNVTKGDNIQVIWGEEEDIFKSITKLIE